MKYDNPVYLSLVVPGLKVFISYNGLIVCSYFMLDIIEEEGRFFAVNCIYQDIFVQIITCWTGFFQGKHYAIYPVFCNRQGPGAIF